MNVLGMPVRVGDLTPTTHKDCNVTGCENLAEWRIGLKFWALHMEEKDRTEGNAAAFETGVVVCNLHMQNMPFPEPEFFAERGRDMVRRTFKSLGKAEPDFDTAKYFFIPTGAKPS